MHCSRRSSALTRRAEYIGQSWASQEPRVMMQSCPCVQVRDRLWMDGLGTGRGEPSQLSLPCVISPPHSAPSSPLLSLCFFLLFPFRSLSLPHDLVPLGLSLGVSPCLSGCCVSEYIVSHPRALSCLQAQAQWMG